MIELLIALVQAICLAGYLCGAWLVTTHSAESEAARQAIARAKAQLDDAAEWQRHLACDV